jgi:enediyne biosynthesis protein E4
MRYSALGLLGASLWMVACSSSEPTLFERLDASKTGVSFANNLQESEQWNILAYEYYYNGGGVAVGDFNNDSLPDLYFTGNQVPNKLYLNKGNRDGEPLKFEDITEKAGVAGRTDGWATGVTVADVNADGYLDLYVCYSGPLEPEKRKNQLFINNGDLTFTERAEAWGVAEAGYSTQATFLDYDRDGDLDLFVMNHNLRNYGRKEAGDLKSARDPDAGDKLYRNEALPGGTPRFVEVSARAGIRSNALGFGLGLAVSDLNHDSWPDIYVGNDYVEEDYVYLNNQDGTFREAGKDMMGHFSFSTMGCDIADVNNDTWPDVFTLDMLPADNERQKLLAWPDSWNVQLSMLDNGFHWQNMRNMLHINRGVGATGSGETPSPQPSFSEVGQLAGVSGTDWSWGGLLADLDNDGFKDIFVSNGYVRDYTNLDFVKYYADQQMNRGGKASLLDHMKQMPATPTHHFIFRNNGDLTFTDKVQEWGFSHNTIACGSAYADLDNDGDLDLITNNTNEPAGIYQNTQQQKEARTYLSVRLGHSAEALGAQVLLYAGAQVQWQENYPTRGFESSSAGFLHFGLGEAGVVDSLRVVWPNGRSQLLTSLSANRVVSLRPSDADEEVYREGGPAALPLLQEISGPEFVHREDDVVDFNRQILLPRQYSFEGPRLAKGDVNGDGREDFFVGGATGQTGALFVQRAEGTFAPSAQPAFAEHMLYEDRAAVFLDADGDGDQDLYVVSGSYDLAPFDERQEDRLYLNDGRGRFTSAGPGMLPGIRRNGSCTVAFDADRDGDTDVFVGGGPSPGEFPYVAESYLLVNDGKGYFTASAGPSLAQGLLTDAAVADINADGWPDLLVVGEWMPITYFISQKGKFDFSQRQTVAGTEGLWLRVKAADLDGDGDTDFVAGNWGLNNPFRNTSPEQPLTLYANDFDRNGTVDPFISYFIQGKEYPLAGRDEALDQYLPFRKKFTDYASYARSTFGELLSEEELKSADQRKVLQLRTGILLNEKGGLRFQALPQAVQQFPVAAIGVNDFDGDGVLDLLLAGNLTKARIRIGTMDAGHGLLLLGDGKTNFRPAAPGRLGVDLKGEVKDLIFVGNTWVVARNNASIRMLKARQIPPL